MIVREFIFSSASPDSSWGRTDGIRELEDGLKLKTGDILCLDRGARGLRG